MVAGKQPEKSRDALKHWKKEKETKEGTAGMRPEIDMGGCEARQEAWPRFQSAGRTTMGRPEKNITGEHDTCRSIGRRQVGPVVGSGEVWQATTKK